MRRTNNKNYKGVVSPNNNFFSVCSAFFKAGLAAKEKIINFRIFWLAPLDMLVMSILLIGLLSVASSSIIDYPKPFDLALFIKSPTFDFVKQTIFAAIGLFLYFSIPYFVSMENIKFARYYIFIFAILLLVLVHTDTFGAIINGRARWLDFHYFKFQPSEFARVAMTILLAFYLDKHRAEVVNGPWHTALLKVSLLLFITLAPIFSEDLSTSIVFISIALLMLAIAGYRLIAFFTVSLVAAIFVILSISMSSYRLNRLNFIFPWNDAQNTGYQLLQALSAQELGGLFGSGYALSVQRLKVLTEANNDFILSIMMEDWGLIPVLFMVILFFGSLIYYILKIAKKSHKNEQFASSYYCYGTAIWIFIQSFFNLAVNLGLAPPTGINLPLISYGGSNLLFTLISLALVKLIALENLDLESNKTISHNRRTKFRRN